MLKRFDAIKNFGVYKDFNGRDLHNFGQTNVIYGWNYSGKTTLSRVFSSVQNKEMHPKFQNGEFKLIHESGVITHQDINTNNKNIRVFNSEYIKDNLKWDNSEPLNPISFELGENIQIREQIDKNECLLDRIEGRNGYKNRREKYNRKIQEFDKFEKTKFSAEASKIRSLLNSSKPFTLVHFKPLVVTVLENLEAYLLKDPKYEEVKKTATATNNKETIKLVTYKLSAEPIHNTFSEILVSCPKQSKTIEILENNKAKYDWAKAGVSLHTEKDSCGFCGSSLLSERIQELNSYFSNEAGKLRNEITACKEQISNEISTVEKIVLPKSKNDLFESLQVKFEDALNLIGNKKQQYIIYLKSLEQGIINKEITNLFNRVTPSNYAEHFKVDLDLALLALNEVLKEHNLMVENFESEKENARVAFILHHVADFLIQEKYVQIREMANVAKSCLSKVDACVFKINKENDSLRGKIKSVVAAQEKLNGYIQTLLGSKDIAIEVGKDDKFNLRRGNVYAENLSEGEKTAISFSYFIASLAALDSAGELKNTIVYIDDPVSSLDSNHIAQIFSFINSFFFRGKKTDDRYFKQLFISTHNADFFSFLKASYNFGMKNGAKYYFVTKHESDRSKIIPLPNTLKVHSEYLYLFELVYSYYKDPAKFDKLFVNLLPNAIRRFLELYTLTKYPGSDKEAGERIKDLLGEIENSVLLNHFSHLASFEKLASQDPLVANIPELVKETIDLVKKDNVHFTSLVDAAEKSMSVQN